MIVEAERGEREVVEKLGEGLVAQRVGRDLRLRKPRQRPSGARIAGDAGGDGDSLRSKPRATVLDERRLAAEEMRNTGNVEHQPVAPIERGERGKAGAPVAEALKKPRLFHRRRLDRDEIRVTRARVGERKADGQSEPRGLDVDADEPLSIVDLGDGRERRRFVNAAESPRAVRRQTRQPEGEKSPDRQKPSPR